jgi:hypothetical protein
MRQIFKNSFDLVKQKGAEPVIFVSEFKIEVTIPTSSLLPKLTEQAGVIFVTANFLDFQPQPVRWFDQIEQVRLVSDQLVTVSKIIVNDSRFRIKGEHKNTSLNCGT